MRQVAASLFVLLLASGIGLPAAAWPVLDEPLIAGGLRCYPDHRDPRLFWFVRDRLSLAVSSGSPGEPGFVFHRFRYTGSSKTGDSGDFWGRGVLDFHVALEPLPQEIEAALQVIGRRTARRIVLEPLPLDRIETALVYVTAGEDSRFGSVPSESWGSEGTLWTERTYSLGMSPLTAQLLWDAYHLEGVALSLNYSLVARGLPTQPDPREAEETHEPSAAIVGGGAIPIQVSPRDCPRCFASTELDAEIPAGYTFLDVFCYDFASGAAPTDLAMVLVDVRASGVRGSTEERIRFLAEGPIRQAVHFKFAVRLDAGYEIRTSRIFARGHIEEGEWKSVPSWTGIQDVTAYTADAARRAALDPRALY